MSRCYVVFNVERNRVMALVKTENGRTLTHWLQRGLNLRWRRASALLRRRLGQLKKDNSRFLPLIRQVEQRR